MFWGQGGSGVITEALLPPGDGRAQVQAARGAAARPAEWRGGGGEGERGGGEVCECVRL